MFPSDTHRLYLFLLALTTISSTKSNEQSNVIKLSPIYSITPAYPSTPRLPVAGGMRNCGGPGMAVEMRYLPCNGDNPCKIPGDEVDQPAQLEFIPSQNIKKLGIRAIVIWDGTTQTLVDQPIENSTVYANFSYISTSSGSAKRELIGKLFTYQWILYSVEDNHVEVCGEADFLVV